MMQRTCAAALPDPVEANLVSTTFAAPGAAVQADNAVNACDTSGVSATFNGVVPIKCGIVAVVSASAVAVTSTIIKVPGIDVGATAPVAGQT